MKVSALVSVATTEKQTAHHGDGAAAQEVVVRAFLRAAEPRAEGGDAEQVGDDDGGVERGDRHSGLLELDGEQGRNLRLGSRDRDAGLTGRGPDHDEGFHGVELRKPEPVDVPGGGGVAGVDALPELALVVRPGERGDVLLATGA